MLTLKRDFSAA